MVIAKIQEWVKKGNGTTLIKCVFEKNKNFEFILEKDELSLFYLNKKVQTIANKNLDISYEIYNLFTKDIFIRGKKPLYCIYDRKIMSIIYPKQIKIHMNKCIYSVGVKNQYHYIELFKKYDEKNYTPYNPNRILNGLTEPQEFESDDYCWGNSSIKEIEENCNHYNTSYD